MNIAQAESFILDLLAQQLPANLPYHGIHHTHDVVNASAWLAAAEGITDEESLKLLKTAALFHDSGYMYTYLNHEEAGCEIAAECLPAFEYTSEQITAICGMIRATKVPQHPRTHLEEILCDADLDYLGRAGFEGISETLHQELLAWHFMKPEEDWGQKQIDFLKQHQYWTQTALAQRQPAKQVQLDKLIQQQSTSTEP